MMGPKAERSLLLYTILNLTLDNLLAHPAFFPDLVYSAAATPRAAAAAILLKPLLLVAWFVVGGVFMDD
jgi:hypothetical protein